MGSDRSRSAGPGNQASGSPFWKRKSAREGFLRARVFHVSTQRQGGQVCQVEFCVNFGRVQAIGRRASFGDGHGIISRELIRGGE
jgi:hypothetical protein